MPLRAVRRQPEYQQRHQQQAHRQVQEKAPAPAHVFREPAAEHGAEQRPEQHDQAEQRHADRQLRQRQPRADDGLRRRDQRTAGEALADPAGDHHRQRMRPAAHHREGNEQRGVRQQEIAQPEHAREPRGERDHHDLRHQVAGRDPRAFGAGCADFTLDLRQRGVRDRDVEGRHQRAERAGRDRDPVGHARAAFVRRRGHRGGRLSHDASRRGPSAYRRRPSPTAPAAACAARGRSRRGECAPARAGRSS